MKKIFLFAVLLTFVFITIAQPDDKDHESRWEKYRAEKVAFLTTNLELSTGNSALSGYNSIHE